MLAGEPVSGCESCYSEEQSGNSSLRLSSNQKMASPIPRSPEASIKHVEYVELFIGSTCNLRCVTCSPTLSTQIFKDYETLGWDLPTNKVTPPSNLQFLEEADSVKQIKFVGGEPLIGKRHTQAVDILLKKDLRECDLIYYTNATVWPSESTQKLWKQARSVYLNLSIDSVGVENDYIRMNSDWTQVNNIVQDYARLSQRSKNLTLQISTTVSSLNLLSLQKIDQYSLRLKEHYPGAKINPPYFCYLTAPSFLAPHAGPSPYIQKALNQSNQGFSKEHFKILKQLENNFENRVGDESDDLLKYLAKLETIRGNSVAEVFPTLYNDCR